MYVDTIYASLPLLLLFFLFPLSSQCDRCPDVPKWGLKAGLQGLLAMGVFYCLGGWLITVEAPGHPGYPPSTQLDAVVKDSLYMYVDTIHVTFAFLMTKKSQTGSMLFTVNTLLLRLSFLAQGNGHQLTT